MGEKMNCKQIKESAENEITALIIKKMQEIQDETGLIVSGINVDITTESSAGLEKPVLLSVDIDLD